MLNKLFALLTSFSNNEIIDKKVLSSLNEKEYHYYYEIIRYWNQLGYILKKTIRSIPDCSINQKKLTPLLYYATFRIQREKIPPKKVITEINLEKDMIFLLEKIKSFSWDIALQNKTIHEKLSIRQAIPSFFIKKLLPVLNFSSIQKEIEYMNNVDENSEITFLVLSEDQESIFKDLQSTNVQFKPDPNIPGLYRTQRKFKKTLLMSKSYSEGRIIFQEKGSASVVQILSASPRDMVWDVCFAPGIKSIIISKNSRDKILIIGSDFNRKRLDQSRLLIEKLKVLKIFTCQMDSILPPFRYYNSFDKILIDAPCSGSGTFLSNPELKWRQNSAFLSMTTKIQEKLLHSAKKYLKSNGILVYSTCSLYPEEGEYHFLRHDDRFESVDLPSWISQSYKIYGEHIKGTGRLFPSIHQTQGFFIGKFKKKAL